MTNLKAFSLTLKNCLTHGSDQHVPWNFNFNLPKAGVGGVAGERHAMTCRLAVKARQRYCLRSSPKKEELENVKAEKIISHMCLQHNASRNRAR